MLHRSTATAAYFRPLLHVLHVSHSGKHLLTRRNHRTPGALLFYLPFSHFFFSFCFFHFGCPPSVRAGFPNHQASLYPQLSKLLRLILGGSDNSVHRRLRTQHNLANVTIIQDVSFEAIAIVLPNGRPTSPRSKRLTSLLQADHTQHYKPRGRGGQPAPHPPGVLRYDIVDPPGHYPQ